MKIISLLLITTWMD